jgi:phage tail-like protein
MPSDAGQLIVQRQGKIERTLPLTVGVVTIGRAPDNGLPLLHDPLVSRHHAELRVEPTGVFLTDLGSSYGTAVGGTRLLAHQPQRLADGATCEIRSYVLIYQAPQREPQTTAPASHAEDPAPAEPASPAQTVVPALPMAAVAHTPPRPTYPMPLPPQEADCCYLRDLPVLFHNQAFLGRFLRIFEAIWEPLEQRQDHIALYFDPRTCPAAFLPWLASWLHLAFEAHWPEARRRHVLAEAMDLYRWRGTRYGLTRMLEVCTGLTPDITEEASQPFVFRISVTIPPGSGIRPELLEALIEAQKPAHAGYQLEVKR